jgi:hypothetical protein
VGMMEWGVGRMEFEEASRNHKRFFVGFEIQANSSYLSGGTFSLTCWRFEASVLESYSTAFSKIGWDS